LDKIVVFIYYGGIKMKIALWGTLVNDWCKDSIGIITVFDLADQCDREIIERLTGNYADGIKKRYEAYPYAN
jgi:hypothetical protein